MIATLFLRSLKRGRMRFACAVLGAAIATGLVVSVFSLASSNDAQAPALAKRLTSPWGAWYSARPLMSGRGAGRPSNYDLEPGEKVAEETHADMKLDLWQMELDYRPDGRVMQGPPLIAILAKCERNPYDSIGLNGRFVDNVSSNAEVVIARSVFLQRELAMPPLGTRIVFVGRKGTLEATLVGVLDSEKIVPTFPSALVNEACLKSLNGEPKGDLSLWRDENGVPESLREKAISPDMVSGRMMTDAGRNFDRSTMLLFWAAALTALFLLLNSVSLSIESNRRELSILRMVGLTRFGMVRLVSLEILVEAFVGWALGTVLALLAVCAYTAFETELFPVGPAFNSRIIVISLVAIFAISLVAILFSLRRAFSVKPLDAAGETRTKGRWVGMCVAFAFGVGSFVAVEVWGASLTKAFVPSPEWPDAIVSMLPAGVNSWQIDKLRGLPGIAEVHELVPYQANVSPFEPLTEGGFVKKSDSRFARGKIGHNVLFLGSDWLPNFKFVEGNYDSATNAIMTSDACVITLMMSNARNLHVGDKLKVSSAGLEVAVDVAGVVDLNWHMVTSRGLLRGMNRMPAMTDGPAFVSFETVDALNPRPAQMMPMTHVWLDFKPDFLAEYGVFQAGRIVEDAIRKAVGNPAGSTIRLHSRDEVADGTLAHGNDMVGAMARVPFIFIAVLSLGFAALLVSLFESRKGEFMTMRAVGATRAQLIAILVREAVKIAFTGTLFGISFGSLVGWLFTSGMRKLMANWGIPALFAIPYEVVALGILGAFVFVLTVVVPVAYCLIARFTKR